VSRQYTVRAYVTAGGKTYRAEIDCEREDDNHSDAPDDAQPRGNWIGVDDDGSTGRLGHYSTQGDRERLARRTRDGLILVLTIGTGYYGAVTGGWDWGWRATLNAIRAGEDTAVDAALGNVVDAATA
jgi:hypothetical protein